MAAGAAAHADRRRGVGGHRGRHRPARPPAQCRDGRRLRRSPPAGRGPAAALAGAGASAVPAPHARRRAPRGRAPARGGLRPFARAGRRLVGARPALPGPVGPGLPAREPPHHRPAVPRGLPRPARAARGGELPDPAAGPAAPVAGRRAFARRAAHARAPQRDLLRAGLPGALPRPHAGRGRRSHGSGQPPVPEDAARAGEGARAHAPGRRRLPRSAGAPARLGAGRARPAAGHAGRRGGGRQRARRGLAREPRPDGLLARRGRETAGRDAAAAGHHDLVVRRGGGLAGARPQAGGLRGGADLPAQRRHRHGHQRFRAPGGGRARARRAGQPAGAHRGRPVGARARRPSGARACWSRARPCCGCSR